MHSLIPSVTVAIPAYNEEHNIGRLLLQILAQREDMIRISEIFVYSDGSSDQTIERVKAVSDERIRIIDGRVRRGANAAQNELVRQAKGDFLVLLNADIILADTACLEKLVEPLIRNSQVGLSSALVQSLPPKTYFERAIAVSHAFKTALYEASFPSGDSPYFCHGRARAFSRSFYRQITWPDQCPEDGYSYFSAKKQGWNFSYVRAAKILFRSSATFQDFSKQSHRFQQGRGILRQYFDTSIVKRAYHLPLFPTAWTLVKFSAHFPEAMLVYAFSLIWVRIATWNKPTEQSRWQISLSSKDVI